MTSTLLVFSGKLLYHIRSVIVFCNLVARFHPVYELCTHIYCSNGVSALVRIIRHLSKLQVLYYTTQLLHEMGTFYPIYSWYCKIPIRMPCLKACRIFYTECNQQFLARLLTLRAYMIHACGSCIPLIRRMLHIKIYFIYKI